MSDLKAVMDLGTNTFHLLIVEGNASDYREIAHKPVHVKLGEGGINKGQIQPEPFERGVKTMQSFSNLIRQHEIKAVRAIATSALRNAANGQDFVQQVKAQTGIDIEIINGDKEAEFIYRGIKAAKCLSTAANSLIVDIGGGSVEFIICNDQQIFWKRSFEIGAARLMDKFQHTDPITQTAVANLDQYLQHQLQDLFTAAKYHKIDQLVGASGVFESYAELASKVKGDTFDIKKLNNYKFEKENLLSLIHDLISSNHATRAANPSIIAVRVDMIVVASILTRFIIEKLGINNIIMSTNSLKEGVLADMFS